jgi:methyl-accepting chemotaxis protein PixJ
MLLNDFSDDLINPGQSSTPKESKKSWGIPLRLTQPKNQRKGMSLRTKATLWALALGTLPVIGVGSGAYVFANRAARQEIQLTQQSQASQVADQLNRFMTERYSDIEMLANLPNLKKLQAKKTALSLPEQQAGLEQLKDSLKVYQSISVFSLEGEVLLQTEGAESVNPFNQPYFQTALKTNQSTISELTTIESAKSTEGESVIYFTAPIKDATTGKTIALIRTQMPVKAIEEVVQSWGNKGDEYRITDRNGKIFLTNANDRLAKTLKIAQDQRFSGTAKTPEISNLPQLDWQVVFAGNVRSMMDSQRNLQLLIASSTLLTAMLVSAIAVTLASFATRPLQDAAEAVEELGKGKFNTRLKVRGRDELGIQPARKLHPSPNQSR